MFIGAKKKEPYDAKGSDAKYEWEYDGKEVVFSNWNDGEPNNYVHWNQEDKNELCLFMFDDGKWNDNHCSGETNSICKDDTSAGVCAKPLQ